MPEGAALVFCKTRAECLRLARDLISIKNLPFRVSDFTASEAYYLRSTSSHHASLLCVGVGQVAAEIANAMSRNKGGSGADGMLFKGRWWCQQTLSRRQKRLTHLSLSLARSRI